MSDVDEEMKPDEKTEPEWLKRIRFSIDAQTDIRPRYYFETVQPLYQDSDKQNTFFIQPRYSWTGQDGTYNIGVGYRRLLFDDNVLLGVNSFWDSKCDHDHYRIGVGGEAFLSLAEFRSNFYFALSPRRQAAETTTHVTYEKAVDGYDLEAGLPVPYLNWVKLYGGYYWYNYKKFKDKEGWRIRTEVKPLKYIVINFIAFNDSKGDPSFRIDGGVTIPFDVFWGGFDEKDLIKVGFSDKPYPEIDHSDRTLDRVEREYNIEVEKWMEDKTTNATIEIRQGN